MPTLAVVRDLAGPVGLVARQRRTDGLGHPVRREGALTRQRPAHGDRDGADAVGGQGLVDAVHEVAHPGLLHAQRRRALPGLVGGHAAGDADATARGHVGARGLEDRQQRADAERDVLEQLRHRQRQRVLLAEGTGVEVQDVDVAGVLTEAAYGLTRRLLVGDVGDGVADGRAPRLEVGHQVVEDLLVGAQQRDVVPLVRETTGHRPADARAGPDDHDDGSAHDTCSTASGLVRLLAGRVLRDRVGALRALLHLTRLLVGLSGDRVA